MSKINATYSSGFYISPDMDYRALEDAKSMQRKRERQLNFKRRRFQKDQGHSPEKDEEENEKNFKQGTAIRQTFALPFDIYCGHCEKRAPRGVHVYTNRRPTSKKYLGAIRIWSLEIRCRYCSGVFYLETDPETPKETGGYKCAKDCRRQQGDFDVLNAMNAEVKAQWASEKQEKAETPLEAMERDQIAARRLAEKNQEIEALVAARDGSDRQTEEGLQQALASALANRQKNNKDGEEKPVASEVLNRVVRGLGAGGEEGSEGLLQGNLGSAPEEMMVELTEEELLAEETAYQQFEAEMLLQQKRKEEAEGSSDTSSREVSSRVAWLNVKSERDASVVQQAEKKYADAMALGSSRPALSSGSGPGLRRNIFLQDDEDDD